MSRANGLLGNFSNVPVLELSMAAITLRSHQTMTIAISDKDSTHFVVIERDEVLEIPLPKSGARTYLAVPGGFICHEILGSVSGVIVKQGDLLRCDSNQRFTPSSGSTTHPENVGLIEVIAGPQARQFDLSLLETNDYHVSLQSNRTGILLDGKAFATAGEFPSEPACVGAIQVNNSGQLMILGPDGPTIGGYPKIAIVREREIGRIAQLRPGEQIRFKLKSG